MTECLSFEDVEKLVREPSPLARQSIAAKISLQLKEESLSAAETEIAEDIIRLLAKDTALLVRKTIAENLKSSPSLPRDVANMLARDLEEEVYFPILRFSEVLTEKDLIGIVRISREESRHTAIAGREGISEELSAELIATDNFKVLMTLAENGSAAISSHEIEKLIENRQKDTPLLNVLVKKGRLGIAQAEKILTLVSDDCRKLIIEKYKIPSKIASLVTNDTREWLALSLPVSKESGVKLRSMQLQELVSHLHSTGRLGYPIILKSLVMADLAFFEAALARIAGIPAENCRRLIWDNGRLGFQALYEKCELPESMFDAIKTLLDIVKEESFAMGYTPMSRKVMMRIYEKITSRGLEGKVRNMDYITGLIGQNVAG